MNDQDTRYFCIIVNNNCVNNKSIVTIKDYSNSIHVQGIYLIYARIFVDLSKVNST